MKDLIEKLAQAEGPSRELDWEIHLRNGLHGVGMYGDHPRYTASIDAALTLVPEGSCWTVAVYWCEGEDKPPYYADCGNLEALKAGAGDDTIFEAWAQTPAIALCIAALSAKEPSQ